MVRLFPLKPDIEEEDGEAASFRLVPAGVFSRSAQGNAVILPHDRENPFPHAGIHVPGMVITRLTIPIETPASLARCRGW